MLRYLEERAPCIYLPNEDWRHSCVAPLLPASVMVVGVLYSSDDFHRDHVRRLGRYWNAIVACSADAKEWIAEEVEALRSRAWFIDPGTEHTLDEYVMLFHRVIEQANGGSFNRPAGRLEPPPREIGGEVMFAPRLLHDEPGVGLFPARSPDYEQFEDFRGQPVDGQSGAPAK